LNWAIVALAVGVFVLLVFPVFVIGKRRGLKNSWAAFIPLLGAWIVLFESIGRSGWLALMVFVPTVGPLVALIWTAVEMPSRHDRSQWWTLVLLIPGVNLIGYWFYAFTLPRDDDLRFAY
jgi:hypothetical protein